MRLPLDKKNDTYVELQYVYFPNVFLGVTTFQSDIWHFSSNSSLVNFPKSRMGIFVIAGLIFSFSTLYCVQLAAGQ
jgi:hypothetical protein